jgi:anti-anti-sigma regulatory factor
MKTICSVLPAPYSPRGGVMKFVLIVAKGKHRGRPIPIHVDLFVIGTARTCQLRADHPDLGEQHCALVTRGHKVFVRDLGSGKPTLVNGHDLPTSGEWPLHKGDTVAVGPLEFRVSMQEKQLSQRDLEEWALRALDEDHGPKRSAFDELDDMMRGPDTSYVAASKAAEAILGKAAAMRGVVRGRLRLTRDGGVTVVRLNDVHLVDEAELSHLKMELQENLGVNNLRVLIDMKNVRRMASAAVVLFADLSQWLKGKGSTMALCRLRPELAGIVGDLRNLFNIRVFDDKDKAVAGKW